MRQSQAMDNRRPSVFLSYSHKDEVWKDRLLGHLSVLEHAGHVEVWDDRRISGGDEWYEEIRRAIDSASVAVLLISADFLTTRYVLDLEVPALLRRSQRGQMRLLPLIVRPCAWQSVSWLSKLQARPRSSKPLSSLRHSELDTELASVAREIFALIRADKTSSSAAPEGSWHVGRIRLENIRGFKSFEVDLRDPNSSRPRQRKLIIGRNGTCKTTLLRAIALSLCDPVDAGALIAEPVGSLVSGDKEVGRVEVDLVARSSEPALLALRQEIWSSEGKDSIRDVGDPRPAVGPFVCAYGAGRFGVGTDTGREYRIRDSVATLFDYRQTLIDSELTLRRLLDFLGSRRFDATLRGIKRVLGLTPEDEIRLGKGGGIEVAGPTIGRRVSLEGWADGYRLTFGWLLDLYGWAMRADRVTPSGGIEGILLVDEIEQHLHPSMQTRILPRLSETLPELQIFATTHSPLVALGVSPEELVSLRRDRGSVIAESAIPDFSDYSAEDMLVDERLFDSEAYSPETSLKLAHYRELSKIPAGRRNEKQVQELKRLAVELRAQQLPEVRESPAAEELRRLIVKHGL